jgi:hypothetical protein
MEDVERWRKSSYSANGGECIEVADHLDTVAVRDSKLDQSPVVAFTPDAWRRFTYQLKSAE